jgi:hypothetical protein
MYFFKLYIIGESFLGFAILQKTSLLILITVPVKRSPPRKAEIRAEDLNTALGLLTTIYLCVTYESTCLLVILLFCGRDLFVGLSKLFECVLQSSLSFS